eukprot:6424493-Ditylum_brightwellii.AAC.1
MENNKNHVAVSTVKNHVDKFMGIRNNNPYSPWARASYCWAKQLAIHYGTIDPYTYKDPKMLSVFPGTKPDWVALYLYDEETKKGCLQKLIVENNEKRRMCPFYAAQPCLPILLPEYDPHKLSPIKVRADWDKTHPKVRIGCVMKSNCPYEYAFARTIDGKVDKAQVFT